MLLKGWILLALFNFSDVYAQNGNACKTAIGENGTCVPVDECTIISDILNYTSQSLPNKTLEYLKKSYCKSEGEQKVVCCAERHLVINKGRPDGNITLHESKETEEVVDGISDHPNLKYLPIDRCGRIDYDKVNGNLTALFEFPWMVLLQYQTKDGLKFLCVGSLISSRYVLTAAHCVTGISDTLVSVRLGEYDTSMDQDCQTFGGDKYCAPPVQDIPVDEVIFHLKYDNKTFSDDIAVVRLKNEPEINDDSVQAVCLPITLVALQKKLNKVTIVGWNLTATRQASNVLNKAAIPVLKNEECQEIYKGSINMTIAQMCAGGENGVDNCEGNSGGPLYFPANVRGLRFVQYGILSAGGNACGGGDGTRNYPGVYTRVPFYIKWILDQLKP